MRFKKIAAILTAAILSAGVLSACGKTPPTASKDHIYSAEMILQTDEKYGYISSIVSDGTALYFYTQKWEQVKVDAPLDDGGEPIVVPALPIAPRLDIDVVSDVSEEPVDEEETEEIIEDTEVADVDVVEDFDVVEDVIDIAVTTDVVSDNSYYISTTKNYIVKTDFDGNIITEKELSSYTSEENRYENFNRLICTDSGKLFGYKQVSTYGTDENGNYIGEEKNLLVEYDSNLNETELFDFIDIIKPDEANGDYFYVNALLVDNNDNAYVTSGTRIFAIDIPTKQIILDLDLMKDETGTGVSDMYLQNLYMMPDGSVGAVLNTYTIIDDEYTNVTTLSTVNLAQKKLNDPVDFPNIYNAVPAEGDYSFYYSDQIAVYGYNKDFTERSVIVDVLASGISNIGINTLIPLSPTEFITSGYDEDSAVEGLFKLTKLDPETIPDKKLLKVASLYQDYYLIRYVREFNKTNTEYQIELKDYSSTGYTNFNQVVTSFNNDIIAGNIPDVIYLNEQVPYDSYVSKGLMMDLTPLFEKDPDLNMDMLVPSMVEALSVEDKLYSIAPYFSIRTLVGKESIFGNETGQTLAELEEKAKAIPGAKLFQSTMTRNEFMNSFVYNVMGNYIDKETGECYFDTPDFEALLELAKTFPEEFNYDNYDWMAEENAYRENRTLLNFAYVSDFRSVVNTEITTYDDAIVYLGYPAHDGETGILAYLQGEVGIMAKAKNPDGAWDFVKGLVTYREEAHQNSPSQRGMFPILQADLDLYAKEAMDRPFYFDYETREKIYYDNTTWVGDGEVSVPNNTEADNAKVYALIDGISTVMRSDNELQNIIEDDIKAFFSGQKTAKETAAIIQDRASTYITESR
ncbi:MAG: extracellular solute-binding protein [Ruminococcus sp.]|nr:extracellular solute-binding protein [Ruminococcus sp.]